VVTSGPTALAQPELNCNNIQMFMITENTQIYLNIFVNDKFANYLFVKAENVASETLFPERQR